MDARSALFDAASTPLQPRIAQVATRDDRAVTANRRPRKARDAPRVRSRHSFVTRCISSGYISGSMPAARIPCVARSRQTAMRFRSPRRRAIASGCASLATAHPTLRDHRAGRSERTGARPSRGRCRRACAGRARSSARVLRCGSHVQRTHACPRGAFRWRVDRCTARRIDGDFFQLREELYLENFQKVLLS